MAEERIGPDEAPIVYVEHLHHEVDNDLIAGSTEKGTQLALKRFAMLFVGITLCSVISCYLNYQFPKNLTLVALTMLLCGYSGDLFILRPLVILALATLTFRRRRPAGPPEETKHSLSTTELGTHQGLTNRTLIDDDASRDLEQPQPSQKMKALDAEVLLGYSLALVKALQEGYGPRADTVIGQFRTSKTAVIKKRVLYPVFNPNCRLAQRLEEIELR